MSKRVFLSVLLIALMALTLLPLTRRLQVTSADASNPTSTVTELWKFPSDKEIVYSPVAANGYVYVTSTNSGGSTRTLYCINASTGSQEWNMTADLATFAVANSYVYVGQGNPGTVSCLNASTGAQVWNFSGGTLFSTPTVKKGVVYVATANGLIYGLDATTGTKIWNFSGPAGTNFFRVPPVLADTTLYALSSAYSEQDASWHSGIYAFNAQTGDKRWNYSTPGQFGSFAVANQAVYVSSNFVNTTDYIDAEKSGGFVYEGGVLALNASDGTKIWDYPIRSSVNLPIVANDTVYAVSDDGKVYALAASDRKVIWSYSTDLETGSPLLVDDHLYVGSSIGVYCFDSVNGLVKWNFETNEYANSWGATVPVYADGVIFFGWNGPLFFSPVTEHNFYALDALNGERVWNYTIGYTVLFSPVLVGSTVYMGATYVTKENPDRIGGGAVLALNSTITSLPHSVSSFPFSKVLVVISIVVVVICVVLIVYFKNRKHRT
jgi:outer membrane protein assembly factor BamB